LEDAKALVVEAGKLNAVRGVKLDAEMEQTNSNGWLFRAYATRKAPGPVNESDLPHSNLIGYYTVDSRTMTVTDVSGEPPYKKIRTT
jgi:hypothetical protein